MPVFSKQVIIVDSTAIPAEPRVPGSVRVNCAHCEGEFQVVWHRSSCCAISFSSARSCSVLIDISLSQDINLLHSAPRLQCLYSYTFIALTLLV